jgi:1-aminocyclopropane-1-carboxylate synthase
VAENSLTAPIIQEKLTAILQQQEMPEWVLKYTNSLGHPEVRATVAQFMEDYLCNCPIDADSIGFSAGASAIIEVSSFVLANPGDVVVIPAPSYPMYTKDLGTKSGLERYDLQTHFNLSEIGSKAPVNTNLLDEVWVDLKRQGKCFKILLLTSPDNPTGCRYSEQELWQLANWCMQHKVHLIVNEIYGLSLIDTQDPLIEEEYEEAGSYASFAQIMAAAKSDYLHLWYAFSKDFAMSGLRFGVVHSLNKAFMTGFENANIPHLVSNITQWMVGEMLKDSAFLDTYIEKNELLINNSYKLVVEALRKINAPYIPARGSLFVWADLSAYLSEDSDKGQEQLWVDLYRNTGLLLTPGEGFQHQKKGLFRIVFSAVPFSHLAVAMDRLVKYFNGMPE